MKAITVQHKLLFGCVLALALTIQPVSAQTGTNLTNGTSDLEFSRNPASVPNRLRELAKPKDVLFHLPGLERVLGPYYDFKKRMKDRYGLAFGLFYAPMVQTATNVGTVASGGVFNFDLDLNAVGRGTDHPGHFLFRAQDRHRYGSLSPTSLFLPAGSLWPTTVPYSPFSLSVLEFAWQQHIMKDRVVFRVGRMIPFAIHDVYSFKSPFDGFNDAAFTLNPTIAFAPAALGLAAGVRPRDDIYIVAGFYDANGSPQRAGFDTFFNTREYLTLLDGGWDPGYLNKDQKVYFGPLRVTDIHLTLWHKDRLKDVGAPEGWGFTLSAEGEIGHYAPFVRAGYSTGTNGGPAILNTMVSAGVGRKEPFGQKNDLIGFAIAWGERDLGSFDTNEDNIPDLNVGNVSQVSTELFYKIQITREFAITPHVEVIFNPALGPEEDVVAVFGLRGKWSM